MVIDDKNTTEKKHWAKEVVQRTKRCDDVLNTRFVQKKINQLTSNISEASAAISDLQIQLSTYWMQTTSEITNQRLAQATTKNILLERTRQATTTAAAAATTTTDTDDEISTRAPTTTTAKNYAREPVDRIEKFILEYIKSCTQHIDESIIKQDEAQEMYNQMRQITKDFRTQTMTLHIQSAAREYEVILHQVNSIIEKFPQKNDDDESDAEIGYAAFKQYHELPSRGQRQQSTTRRRRNNGPDSSTFTRRGLLGPAIINQANIKLTEQEHQLLRLGPRFIFDDPKTAARRRTTELATLKRKLEARFFEKKVSPGRPVEQFIAELDVLLQNLHNIPTTKKQIQFNRIQTNKSFDNLSSIIQSSQSSQSQTIIRPRKKKNYGRIVKRLKYKIHLANTILRKTDKSKVFHLGKVDHYQKKSEEYMDNTKAYQCLGTIDPLPDLIQRTNRYLLDLRLAKWITQKQYEQLSIKSNEVELAHLYYLPKAHKPGTPLRPIISGLKHPTIKISKFLDDLLRPLFDQMALDSTVTSGFELIKNYKNGQQLICVKILYFVQLMLLTFILWYLK
ncbi:unnamed protein product [Rotaria socialis]|uniref:Uncharacterized protein n=1 Tax=Rotaria socialis TaxID=392032 RepID=A0A820PI58_9BILA|nr:unnamed protein product [Rotaria socialis]